MTNTHSIYYIISHLYHFVKQKIQNTYLRLTKRKKWCIIWSIDILRKVIVMDIKEQINSIVTKLSTDETLLKKFKKNPTSVVKTLLGKIDLTDDIIEKIVAGVKAKLGISDASGLISKISGLFKK